MTALSPIGPMNLANTGLASFDAPSPNLSSNHPRKYFPSGSHLIPRQHHRKPVRARRDSALSVGASLNMQQIEPIHNRLARSHTNHHSNTLAHFLRTIETEDPDLLQNEALISYKKLANRSAAYLTPGKEEKYAYSLNRLSDRLYLLPDKAILPAYTDLDNNAENLASTHPQLYAEVLGELGSIISIIPEDDERWQAFQRCENKIDTLSSESQRALALMGLIESVPRVPENFKSTTIEHFEDKISKFPTHYRSRLQAHLLSTRISHLPLIPNLRDNSDCEDIRNKASQLPHKQRKTVQSLWENACALSDAIHH